MAGSNIKKKKKKKEHRMQSILKRYYVCIFPYGDMSLGHLRYSGHGDAMNHQPFIIHDIIKNMAYDEDKLFILICPRPDLNSDRWDHKLVCYKLSHPWLSLKLDISTE